jgi:hypothetical protein
MASSSEGDIDLEEMLALVGDLVLMQTQAYELRALLPQWEKFCYARTVDRWNLRSEYGSEGYFFSKVMRVCPDRSRYTSMDAMNMADPLRQMQE